MGGGGEDRVETVKFSLNGLYQGYLCLLSLSLSLSLSFIMFFILFDGLTIFLHNIHLLFT